MELVSANVSHDASNLTGHHRQDIQAFEMRLYLAVKVVFSLIIIFGLVGNSLVILVISLNKHMKSSTNILLLNLAVADLSFILLCVIFTLFRFTGRWVFGDAWCKIMNYVNFVSAWVSCYTLVLLCFDRVIAVVFAVRFKNLRSIRNGVVAIAVVWLVCFLANVPALIFHGELSYIAPDKSVQLTCVLLPTVSSTQKQVFQLCFFIFGFALPVAVISVLYATLIVFIARKAGRATTTKTISKAKRRVTVTVIVVVSAFIICWLPLQILMLLSTFDLYKNSSQIHISLQIAANCLAYMNSCINPALYTLTSTAFRSAFIDLLCCRQHSGPSERTTRRESAITNRRTNGKTKDTSLTKSTAIDAPEERKPFVDQQENTTTKYS